MGYDNESVEKIKKSISSIIVGKEDTVEKLLVALFAGGHVLIEDVPGVGKTTLVNSVSRSIGCSFRRIQFTPDLLPSDITGVTIFNMKLGEFEFKQGPITANIVLADEINRGSPKTQSSLLEAMQEKQITVDGNTYRLPEPFMVLATQNPIEYEGTFPLPEAQIDRFSIRLTMGYPGFFDEKSLLSRDSSEDLLKNLQAVISDNDVLELRKKVQQVHVDDSIQDYIVNIVRSTRDHKDIYLGCSPRSTIALFNNCRALAFIKGREYVLPDDVRALAVCTLAHRLILKSDAVMQEKDQDAVLMEVLNSIRVPVAKNNG
ncbi:MAG TPA: MoxR family ATPase [Negativicutes bacterium]|nr:MoxR family ATPase [Negativicutes bacterium]